MLLFNADTARPWIIRKVILFFAITLFLFEAI